MWTTHHHHHHQFMRVDVDNGAPRSIAVYFSLQLLRLAGPVEDGGLSTCLLNLLLVRIFIACNCVVSPWHRRGDCLAEVHRQCTWHRGQPFMCKSAPASEGPIHLPDNILITIGVESLKIGAGMPCFTPQATTCFPGLP